MKLMSYAGSDYDRKNFRCSSRVYANVSGFLMINLALVLEVMLQMLLGLQIVLAIFQNAG